MTPEEKENIKELISRYRQWLSAETWSSIYYKSKEQWRSGIEAHIKNLEKKLKQWNK